MDDAKTQDGDLMGAVKYLFQEVLLLHIELGKLQGEHKASQLGMVSHQLEGFLKFLPADQHSAFQQQVTDALDRQAPLNDQP